MCSFNQQITECQGLLLAGGRPPAVQQAASRKGGAIPRGAAIPKDRKQQHPGGRQMVQVLGILRALAQSLAPCRNHKILME